jgi:PTS system N-acetylgalactosamine-specific IIA component
MIGIIVTGHGNFATGLESSLKLITGEQKNCKAIDFIEGMTTEELEAKLITEVKNMNECEHVFIFTDLVGGSPFKTVAKMMQSEEKIKLLSGTNLGYLIECVLTRDFQTDVDLFINQLLETGKTQVMEFKGIQKRVEVEEEDGI